MKKLIVCICACLVIAFKPVSADESNPAVRETTIEKYITTVYNQIDFGKSDKISYEAFDKAYHGYLNLRNAGKLNTDKQILTICDFSLASKENRLWIIDLDAKKILFNTYVAHGQGSGDDYAQYFSNDFDSHQSSLGFYVTGETYMGEHGTSLRLSGMDNGYNDAAFDRGIVVHGAEYVCNKFACTNQRIGRSWGCPAVPAKLSLPIINAIKGGTCLFIYYPDKNYLKNAYWVNKKITEIPGNEYASAAVATNASTAKMIEYISHGKIDSIVTIPAVAPNN
jgi:hypothetical protein